MSVMQIALDPENNYIVVLKENEGRRALPIMIGPHEAKAIELTLHGLQVPRPMTHDLIRNILMEIGARVRRIVVTELRDRTYFAVIDVEQNGNVLDIDARPSDAIALALRCGAPIFVEDAVVEDAGIVFAEDSDEIVSASSSEEDPETAQRFREIIQDIDIDDLESS